MPYIAYLTNPNATNLGRSHPGWGATKEDALKNSRYFNNQQPYVAVVPASRAPRWAQATAWDDRRSSLEARAIGGEFLPEGCLSKPEWDELENLRIMEIHGVPPYHA